jgi:hypothetical protein
MVLMCLSSAGVVRDRTGDHRLPWTMRCPARAALHIRSRQRGVGLDSATAGGHQGPLWAAGPLTRARRTAHRSHSPTDPVRRVRLGSFLLEVVEESGAGPLPGTAPAPVRRAGENLPRVCRGSFATGTKKPTGAIASVGLAGQEACIGCAPIPARGIYPVTVSLATEPVHRRDAGHWDTSGKESCYTTSRQHLKR